MGRTRGMCPRPRYTTGMRAGEAPAYRSSLHALRDIYTQEGLRAGAHRILGAFSQLLLIVGLTKRVPATRFPGHVTLTPPDCLAGYRVDFLFYTQHFKRTKPAFIVVGRTPSPYEYEWVTLISIYASHSGGAGGRMEQGMRTRRAGLPAPQDTTLE